MAFYREVEPGISRDYELRREVCEKFPTQKATIEIVPSKIHGSMLFIDGQLQLARKDEYIYHEMLIHPAILAIEKKEDLRVCILGGGDGCALREVLKWKQVAGVDLFDWDNVLVELFKTRYSDWNEKSLQDPRVSIHHIDVRKLAEEEFQYDIIIIDLLDPNCREKESVKLWQTLLEMSYSWIGKGGTMVLNAGAVYPWKTETPTWLYSETMHAFRRSLDYELCPYKVFVPSFATEWCFFLLKERGMELKWSDMPFKDSLNYLDPTTWLQATMWPRNNRFA